MAYPGSHLLLNLSGVHYGAERFSIGFRLNLNFFPNDEAAQGDVCADYAAAVVGWWDTNTIIGTQAGLDTVKLNVIGPDGRYTTDWTNQVDLPAPVLGNNGSSFPPQVALVASLMTARTRGLANRGRTFVPAPVASLSSASGLLTGASVTTFGNGFVGLINAINGVEAGRRIHIYSDVGAGAANEVTNVMIGQVLDTVRSRRRSLEEARVPFAIAAGPG